MHVLCAATFLLLGGCSHTGPAPSERGAITVYVGGSVNKPGKHVFGPPFTVEHAIAGAGGLDEFERDWNRHVVIRRSGSQDISVARKQYASFRLMEDDGIAVPRH